MKVALGKAVALAVGLLFVSGCCGAGKKIKECNELISTINEGINKAKATDPTTPANMGKFGDIYDDTGKKVEKLSISTPELKAEQAEYVAMTKEVAKAAHDAASGKGKHDAAVKEIQKAAKDENTIVDKINKTCTSK